MGKVWEKECGECLHIKLDDGCHWGFPCAKHLERRQAFAEKNKTMDFMDLFRFSPDLWVRSGWEACRFFEYELPKISESSTPTPTPEKSKSL